jgi:hypothetical protein
MASGEGVRERNEISRKTAPARLLAKRFEGKTEEGPLSWRSRATLSPRTRGEGKVSAT